MSDHIPDRSDAASTPEVSIIIVNWNSSEYLRKCIHSILNYTKDISYEVVVIDNASFDGSKEIIAQEFPDCIFVQSAENMGFARANNLAVGHSRGRSLLFLNPDTELTENAIAQLYRAFTNLPEAGALGCRLLNGDRSLQESCVQAFPTVLNQLLDARLLHRAFPNSRLWGNAVLRAQSKENAEEVEALCGACILVDRQTFERIGGFTESYFMYGEDLDLCYKIKRAGRKVYHLPMTSVIHHGGGSSNAGGNAYSDVMMRDSVWRFLRLHHGSFSGMFYKSAMASAASARIILVLLLCQLSRKGASASLNRSLAKWKAILRWSVGSQQMRTEAGPANRTRTRVVGI